MFITSPRHHLPTYLTTYQCFRPQYLWSSVTSLINTSALIPSKSQTSANGGMKGGWHIPACYGLLWRSLVTSIMQDILAHFASSMLFYDTRHVITGTSKLLDWIVLIVFYCLAYGLSTFGLSKTKAHYAYLGYDLMVYIEQVCIVVQ
jgi:hypothetical protein